MNNHISENQLIDIAFGIFVKRSDGTAPKLCKLVGDRFFVDPVSAEECACQMEQIIGCKLEVRELRVSVGDVIQ
jgi:hypothetical protein